MEITLAKEKVKEWPEDWDIHILNTFELYFDNSNSYNIGFVKGDSSFSSLIAGSEPKTPTYREMRDNISISSIKLSVILSRRKDLYSLYFVHRHGKDVVGIVMRIKSICKDECKMAISNPIDVINESSAYLCASKAEQIIANDNNDDDDGPGIKPEPSPVKGVYSFLNN